MNNNKVIQKLNNGHCDTPVQVRDKVRITIDIPIDILGRRFKNAYIVALFEACHEQ